MGVWTKVRKKQRQARSRKKESSTWLKFSLKVESKIEFSVTQNTRASVMRNEVDKYSRHYEFMKLAEQPGENLLEKMLNAYRSSNRLPPKLKQLSNEEILQELNIEDIAFESRGVTE